VPKCTIRACRYRYTIFALLRPQTSWKAVLPPPPRSVLQLVFSIGDLRRRPFGRQDVNVPSRPTLRSAHEHGHTRRLCRQDPSRLAVPYTPIHLRPRRTARKLAQRANARKRTCSARQAPRGAHRRHPSKARVAVLELLIPREGSSGPLGRWTIAAALGSRHGPRTPRPAWTSRSWSRAERPTTAEGREPPRPQLTPKLR
jgi:hypothetical protein